MVDEVEIASMVVVGRIDNDQILLSMDALRGALKDTTRETTSLLNDFTKLTLAAGIAGIAFGVFSSAAAQLFEVSRVAPGVQIGLESIGLALLNFGNAVAPIVTPVLQSMAENLHLLSETVRPVIEFFVSMGLDDTIAMIGEAAVVSLIAWKLTGNLPFAAGAGALDLTFNFIKNFDTLGFWEKLILLTFIGGFAGTAIGSLVGAPLQGLAIGAGAGAVAAVIIGLLETYGGE